MLRFNPACETEQRQASETADRVGPVHREVTWSRQLEDYISAGRLNIYTDVLKLKPGEELGWYNWNKPFPPPCSR
jgi:regulator of sigma D